MKDFTKLFLALDHTNKTNEKVGLLKHYFKTAAPADKIWALSLFIGWRPPRFVKSTELQRWAMEVAQLPEWLYRESYHSVGDMAETISLILPASLSTSTKTLSDWFHAFSTLGNTSEETKKEFILSAWRMLSRFEVFVFNKLMMGSFRIGVSKTLVIRAVAAATENEAALITHRVMGNWNPYHTSFETLILSENKNDEYSRPYPFYLAYPLETELEKLGTPEEWIAEWKWDGIRAQIIYKNNQLYIWSRGEELVTDKFPELHELIHYLPEGSVFDGELICFKDNQPLPFNLLQTRIGRKNISRKILKEAPVAFLAYDLLEKDYQDVRSEPFFKRRLLLEEIYQQLQSATAFKLPGLVQFPSWDVLRTLHLQSRENNAEGFMLKRKIGLYQTGRKKGDMWKWKVDPFHVDAVLLYAQKGHGRRSEFYTDYTFGIWDKDKLVPFAKAYSGLTDAEIKQVDYFVKRNTLEKFGPVRTVVPTLVFEIGFEGINASTRHKSGIAVRFPRILHWRKDKKPEEADSIESLKRLLPLDG